MSVTPVWIIVLMAFTYGFLTSLQYTSMNTLAYADVNERASQRRQHHREHRSANGGQLRRRRRIARRRPVHPRPPACRPRPK